MLMRIGPFEKTVLACLCCGILGVVLKYMEAATLGVAGDSYLWNTALSIVAMGAVYTVFWYWSGDMLWFLPPDWVDQ